MNIKKDIHFSIKAIWSILSGYLNLETKSTLTGHFEEVDPECTVWWENPYYVCALFKNGRHIPLPLILEPEASEYPIQRAVIWVADKLGLLEKAKKDCLCYVKNFGESHEEEYYYHKFFIDGTVSV